MKTTKYWVAEENMRKCDFTGEEGP